jgi:hypothetical protein
MERRLLKVLKGLAEYLDISLADLLEGIVLHALDHKPVFSDATVTTIERLREVYGLELTAADSHELHEAGHGAASAQDMAATPRRRVKLTGTIEIPLPPGEAFPLFSATGERAWASRWDPRFPVPGSDETQPGTVFETDNSGRQSTWVVVRCTDGELIGYATLTPGDRCGLVMVSCQPSATGTRATVSYDLTALSPESDAELATFELGYPAFLRHWEQSITAAIAVNRS